MWELAVPVAIGVLAFLVIGLLLAKLYRRSTRDEAYVRTGLGGQKVVLDGGSLVLPVFHSTAAVNLKTLRLEVARGGPDSLITKDRMRVDIGAEFYLRVKPDSSSIALAAQTLGNRTNDAAELRELVEAKFVDGLRSVAATMNLEELQEQRATFVKAVQDAVGADIQNNGLELESVSLTRLDQSDIKHFNPSNFFDAHGLTTLTKITKEREQERNQIVRTTEVNIAQQDLVARQTTLTIESNKREAELSQQRDIANKTAAMRAQTAQVEQTALQNEAEYRIQQELAVANKQTEANQARDTRKIDALYNLTGDDVREQGRFDDAIGIFPEFIDGYGLLILPTTGRYFHVPYRSLVPRGVGNLLVAGRCIGGDKISHAAVRNMMCCAVSGQGAGTAAAVSLRTDESFGSLDVRAVQKELLRQGARIE